MHKLDGCPAYSICALMLVPLLCGLNVCCRCAACIKKAQCIRCLRSFRLCPSRGAAVFRTCYRTPNSELSGDAAFPLGADCRRVPWNTIWSCRRAARAVGQTLRRHSNKAGCTICAGMLSCVRRRGTAHFKLSMIKMLKQRRRKWPACCGKGAASGTYHRSMAMPVHSLTSANPVKTHQRDL